MAVDRRAVSPSPKRASYPTKLCGNGARGSHHGLAATAAHSREAGYIFRNCHRQTSKDLARQGGPYISAQGVLKHLFVETPDRPRPSALAILVLELLQPPHLGRQQTVILAFPIEIGRLANSRLAADIATGIPSAPCLRINAFWASENLDAFIALRSSQPGESTRKTLTKNDPVLRPQSTFNKASKNVAENVPLLILFAMLASVSLRPCFASRSATHHIGHRPCGYDYDSEK